MLIARAPVRLSFAGGGTDLPAYYERHGGAVLSTTIDRFVYVLLNITQSRELQITSSDYRTFYRHNGEDPVPVEGDLSLPKAILQSFGITHGARIFLASEVPPGTGLGSSSSVAVAITKAVSTACGLRFSRAEIAEFACDMEIRKMGMPIGKQDQYASAFGGFNFFTFQSTGVEIEPLRVTSDLRERLQQRILLFYTGASHNSSAVLSEQAGRCVRNEESTMTALHTVKALAFDAKRLLEQGRLNEIGELLHFGWQEKKKFAPGVSRPAVDEVYDLARSKGALGGKLTGAGGGGFLMFFCEPRNHSAVTLALERNGLKRMDFNFEQSGARVLMNASVRLSLDTLCAVSE